jgi:hypothetical protein
MKVFLDSEASSLSDRSYPIEVAWVFQDERSEQHLIAPAPASNEWDDAAEVIHDISRATLAAGGKPHDMVANRMVEALPVLPPARLDVEVHNILVSASAAKDRRPAHRALAGAVGEYETGLRARQAARALIVDRP